MIGHLPALLDIGGGGPPRKQRRAADFGDDEDVSGSFDSGMDEREKAGIAALGGRCAVRAEERPGADVV